jgi:16S rRNA (guanine(527)-N(7))-methyltransferase RsmG
LSFRKALVEACRELGLDLRPPVLEKAVRYRDLLAKWSARISLHSVADDEELARLHFAEAFWASRFVAESARLADIGSGAGFPGLALALWREDLSVWLLERNLKKRVFLETVSRELGIPARVAGDAETWTGWREIDVATLRALRLGEALWGRLGEAGVRLVHFRGPGGDPLPPGWRCVSQELFPLSDRRVVAVCQPPAHVPRETF